MDFFIKSSKDLSDIEIKQILHGWNVEERNHLSPEKFRHEFSGSEFYLLYDNNKLVTFCRRIKNFKFELNGNEYKLSQLAGLVSLNRGKGFAKELMDFTRIHLQAEKIECIGFCKKYNREFYEKCGIEVFPGKASTIVEGEDDIVNINLGSELRKHFLP